MALTDADRLQMTAMALMRHSVVGGGGSGAPQLINYNEKLSPMDNLEYSFSHDRYGADITSGQTYICYSSHSTYTPSKAFDDNAGTYYLSYELSNDGYIGVDFGTGKEIGFITIKQGAYGVKDFVFQGSNDGSNWTDLYAGTASSTTGLQPFEIGNTASYRYYRIKNNGAPYGSSYILIYEIEMKEGL